MLLFNTIMDLLLRNCTPIEALLQKLTGVGWLHHQLLLHLPRSHQLLLFKLLLLIVYGCFINI